MILGRSLVAPSPFEAHLVNSKRKNHSKKKAVEFVLMLTSMVDMFSILVIFLLQTFSSSPEILVSNGVVLPDSKTPAIVQEAPVLAISKDGNVYWDQELVDTISNVLANQAKLTTKINAMKKAWTASHPNEALSGRVNVQSDKEVSSTTVSQILGVLTNSHFGSIQLAVMGGSK